MSQFVHLVGAEQVERAASRMSSAAQDMQRAASHMESILDGHHRFMENWLNEYRLLLEQHAPQPQPSKDT